MYGKMVPLGLPEGQRKKFSVVPSCWQVNWNAKEILDARVKYDIHSVSKEMVLAWQCVTNE